MGGGGGERNSHEIYLGKRTGLISKYKSNIVITYFVLSVTENTLRGHLSFMVGGAPPY